MRDYTRLDSFLDRLAGDIYPEPPGEPHLSITRQVISTLVENGTLTSLMSVLDVGCGQGLALSEFNRHGITAIGLVLGNIDAEACLHAGFSIRRGDQAFMPFGAAEFDFLWSRHCLEHSFSPVFALHEYHRVLKSGGRAYIEVPVTDTSAHHERNPNHYSVLSAAGWRNLVERRFVVEADLCWRFAAPCGPDIYAGFIVRR